VCQTVQMLCAFIRACSVNSTMLGRIHNYLDVELGITVDFQTAYSVGDMRSESG